MSSVSSCVPGARIVHDKFHVAKYLRQAVDKVRRREHRESLQEGEGPLTGHWQLYLYDRKPLGEARCFGVLTVQRTDVKAGRAWAVKENIRHIWSCGKGRCAETFFERWNSWAIRSRLDPIKETAVVLKKHLGSLLGYFGHRVTNATREGFNSRFQSIKVAARGFLVFTDYRTCMLFYCGRLETMSKSSHQFRGRTHGKVSRSAKRTVRRSTSAV